LDSPTHTPNLLGMLMEAPAITVLTGVTLHPYLTEGSHWGGCADLVNGFAGTPANTHDVSRTESLFRGSQTEVFADAGLSGLTQGTAQLPTLFALSTLRMARRQIFVPRASLTEIRRAQREPKKTNESKLKVGH
jgi:hypothetical protein